jgi:hypothetical protein
VSQLTTFMPGDSLWISCTCPNFAGLYMQLNILYPHLKCHNLNIHCGFKSLSVFSCLYQNLKLHMYNLPYSSHTISTPNPSKIILFSKSYPRNTFNNPISLQKTSDNEENKIKTLKNHAVYHRRASVYSIYHRKKSTLLLTMASKFKPTVEVYIS